MEQVFNFLSSLTQLIYVTVIFNTDNIQDITWNLEAFSHLDMPPMKKEIVQVLIESHTQKAATFDDFVPGKGRGLIFALHGKLRFAASLLSYHLSSCLRSSWCRENAYCRSDKRRSVLSLSSLDLFSQRMAQLQNRRCTW